jgi:hypothetical protein
MRFLIVLLALLFLASLARADDVRVTADAGSKVSVKVEPARRGFFERFRERRTAQPVQVVALPMSIFAGPAMLPEYRPATASPNTVRVEVKK